MWSDFRKDELHNLFDYSLWVVIPFNTVALNYVIKRMYFLFNQDGVKIDAGQVILADYTVSNGVIHIVDTVLIPAGMFAWSGQNNYRRRAEVLLAKSHDPARIWLWRNVTKGSLWICEDKKKCKRKLVGFVIPNFLPFRNRCSIKKWSVGFLQTFQLRALGNSWVSVQ